MASGTVVTLASPPAVLPLYLRTALAAATARGGRGGGRLGGGRDGGPGGGPEGLRHRGFRLERVVPAAEHVDRYRDVVGGGAVDRLPLLYPHLLGFGLQLSLMTQPGFPFPALGLVHVTNRVESVGPIPLGAVLDVEVTVGEVQAHPKGRAVDLVTAVSRDGDVVWTETSTYLHRERSGGGEPSSAATGPDTGPAGSPGSAGPAGSSGPAGSAAGAEATDAGDGDRETGELALHLSARRRLPADLGRRYAAVSGDRNPIHLYPWTAKAFGFPRAIAHGMWSAAAVLVALEPRLPDAVRYDVQFRRPLLLPGTVRLLTGTTEQGLVAELRGREEKDTLHLSAQVEPLTSG